MDYLALFGIAVGLSMDAFAVALTNGAVTRNLKLKHALGIALAFGAFQAAMPTIGWSESQEGISSSRLIIG